MATQKGGVVDAAGEKIPSVRVVTDQDANSGIGGVLDPMRVDPTGTTVQPVSLSAGVVISSGAVTANAGTNLNTSALALESGGNLAAAKADLDTIAATVSASKVNASVVFASAQHVIIDSATLGTVVVSGPAAAALALDATVSASQPRKLQDGSGNAITSTAGALDVNIKTPATLPVSLAAAVDVSDRVGRLVGHVTVDAAPTTAVTVASLPLPAGASQETGNLATLVSYGRNTAQMLDVLTMILAQLKLLNLNFASNSPSSYVDADTILIDSIPTL